MVVTGKEIDEMLEESEQWEKKMKRISLAIGLVMGFVIGIVILARQAAFL